MKFTFVLKKAVKVISDIEQLLATSIDELEEMIKKESSNQYLNTI